jgi:hypothetical protein
MLSNGKMTGKMEVSVMFLSLLAWLNVVASLRALSSSSLLEWTLQACFELTFSSMVVWF